MITDAQLQNWFTYHPADVYSLPHYIAIREGALAFARILVDNTVLCPDQSVALRKLREAVMTANASIACGGE